MRQKSVRFIVAAALLFFFARQSFAADYSGIWWDPALSGQGVTVHQEGSSIFGGWYFYDYGGWSTWLTFEGKLLEPLGKTLYTKFKRFWGSPFGETWNPSEVVFNTYGNLTLTFNSSSSATFDYSLDGYTGTLNLVRFGNKNWLTSLNNYSNGESIQSIYETSACSEFGVPAGYSARENFTVHISTSGSSAIATASGDAIYYTFDLQYVSGDAERGVDFSGTFTESVSNLTGTVTFQSLRVDEYLNGKRLEGFGRLTFTNGCTVALLL